MRPQPGSTITIEPLRSLEQVQRVRDALKHSPRDLAAFTLGVNTNLRATDLLALRADQIDWLSGTLILRERKKGKKRTTPIDPRTIALLAPLIPPDGQGLLFPSSKTGQPLGMTAWNHIIKAACFKAGIPGNYGARTIRKTWARMQFEVFKTPIHVISMELNHSSLRETYFYLALTPPETERVYGNFI